MSTTIKYLPVLYVQYIYIWTWIARVTGSLTLLTPGGAIGLPMKDASAALQARRVKPCVRFVHSPTHLQYELFPWSPVYWKCSVWELKESKGAKDSCYWVKEAGLGLFSIYTLYQITFHLQNPVNDQRQWFVFSGQSSRWQHNHHGDHASLWDACCSSVRNYDNQTKQELRWLCIVILILL